MSTDSGWDELFDRLDKDALHAEVCRLAIEFTASSKTLIGGEDKNGTSLVMELLGRTMGRLLGVVAERAEDPLGAFHHMLGEVARLAHDHNCPGNSDGRGPTHVH